MAIEERGRRQHHVGAEHHQLAMREIEHAADAIDQHVAAGDQRVDRRKDDDVDDELHEKCPDRLVAAARTRAAAWLSYAVTSPRSSSSPARARSCCRPIYRRGSRAACGNGCP